MQEVMDMYQRSVFSREVVRKFLPLHYEDLLYRLQQTLQHCVSTPLWTHTHTQTHKCCCYCLWKLVLKNNRDGQPSADYEWISTL